MSRRWLPIQGWEEQSVFGWDPSLETWYAQLTPNGTDIDKHPVVWLSGITKRIPTRETLEKLIAQATGYPLYIVTRSIAEAYRGEPMVDPSDANSWEPENRPQLDS